MVRLLWWTVFILVTGSACSPKNSSRLQSRSDAPCFLKITDLRVAVLRGAPMTTPIIRIDTDQGLSGYGEVRDAADPKVATILKPQLLGQNPCDVDAVYRSIVPFAGHGRDGGGVSAVEMALWDIVGKVKGVPVYKLLGAKFRDRIKLYADTPEDHSAQRYHPDGRPNGLVVGQRLKERLELGYTFLKFDVGVGLLDRVPQTTMVRSDESTPELTAELTTELTDKGVAVLAGYVAEVRSVIGMRVPLAADHFGPITVASAIRLGNALEPYNLAWMEDVLPWWLTAANKTVSGAIKTPLLTGEDIFGLDGFQSLMSERAVDMLQPDIATAGGIRETKRIGDTAETHGIPMVLHYAGSPIGFAASLHVAAATNNFLVLENHSVDVAWWQDLVSLTGSRHPLIQGGFALVPDGPGLGVEPVEDVFRQHSEGGGYFEAME